MSLEEHRAKVRKTNAAVAHRDAILDKQQAAAEKLAAQQVARERRKNKDERVRAALAKRREKADG